MTHKVTGVFRAVCSVRDENGHQAFTLVSVEVRANEVTKVDATQPDDASIVFRRADKMHRSSARPLNEIVTPIAMGEIKNEPKARGGKPFAAVENAHADRGED